MCLLKNIISINKVLLELIISKQKVILQQDICKITYLDKIFCIVNKVSNGQTYGVLRAPFRLELDILQLDICKVCESKRNGVLRAEHYVYLRLVICKKVIF